MAQDMAQDVAEDVSGTAEDGNVKVCIFLMVIVQRFLKCTVVAPS